MKTDASSTTVSLGLMLLRVGAGMLLFWGHGLRKLLHFTERAPSFADPIGVGPTVSLALVVFAEVFCALFVALGLATRWAAIPPVVFFLVAFFIHHADDPFRQKELALVFLVPFLALIFTGAGRFSLDALIASRARKRG